MKFLIPTLAAIVTAGAVQVALAADAGKHVRGTVSSASATSLTVATETGPVTVTIDAKTKVVGVVPAKLADVKPGTFIGTANVPGGKAARALEVVIFPKEMNGLGEGDYPWDLPAGKKHSTMTNGTVSSGGSGSTMTNATVSQVASGAMKTVTLNYKGGTKTVAIPPDAPIVLVVPGSKDLLKKGAHVVAFPAATGASPFVVVGEKGAIPPM